LKEEREWEVHVPQTPTFTPGGASADSQLKERSVWTKWKDAALFIL
jgi:hypothetical protein